MTQQMRVPWMHSIVLTTQNTAYNLYTLVAAITPSIPAMCQSVQIQVDIGGGAARVYVGSPDSLATNDCGVVLTALSATQPIGYTSDMLNLKDISLMSDTNATQLNVVIITR